MSPGISFQTTCMQCPWRHEKDVGSPGTGVAGSVSCLIWVPGTKPRSLRKVANAFSHRAISPDLSICLLNTSQDSILLLCLKGLPFHQLDPYWLEWLDMDFLCVEVLVWCMHVCACVCSGTCTQVHIDLRSWRNKMKKETYSGVFHSRKEMFQCNSCRDLRKWPPSFPPWDRGYVALTGLELTIPLLGLLNPKIQPWD